MAHLLEFAPFSPTVRSQSVQGSAKLVQLRPSNQEQWDSNSLHCTCGALRCYFAAQWRESAIKYHSGRWTFISHTQIELILIKLAIFLLLFKIFGINEVTYWKFGIGNRLIFLSEKSIVSQLFIEELCSIGYWFFLHLQFQIKILSNSYGVSMFL